MLHLSKTSMLKALSLCFVFVLCSITQLHAQKAKDVLEKGQRIKSDNRIFLTKEGDVLKYNINETPKVPTPMDDDMIFLAEKNEVSIYIRPLNPLSFQFKAVNEVIVDPINEEASNAAKQIFDMLETVKPKMATAQGVPCAMYDNMKGKVDELKTLLTDDQKKTIAGIFTKLKDLPFDDKDLTRTDLDNINKLVDAVGEHFKSIDDAIKALNEMIKGYNCPDPDPFIVKFVFSATLKELENIRNEQIKRFTNLKQVYKLVNDVQVDAAKDKYGVTWWVKLLPIPVTEGNISVYTVTITVGGYKLSGDEIVTLDSKELIKKSFKVRRFQRLVPEVSAGTAYTFFEYTQYGTGKNAAGDQVVTDAGKKSINNLKFTAMINYNFFLTHSPIHPFWQIGVGANSEIPTLMTGLGARVNFDGLRRLAISGGVALTWIKQLDKLKIGDKVAGTADIEKDLQYKFNKHKPFYVGLQYNF